MIHTHYWRRKTIISLALLTPRHPPDGLSTTDPAPSHPCWLLCFGPGSPYASGKGVPISFSPQPSGEHQPPYDTTSITAINNARRGRSLFGYQKGGICQQQYGISTSHLLFLWMDGCDSTTRVPYGAWSIPLGTAGFAASTLLIPLRRPPLWTTPRKSCERMRVTLHHGQLHPKPSVLNSCIQTCLLSFLILIHSI